MSPSSNPFVYVFPTILLIAVVGYFAYGTVDRVGLAPHAAQARVTSKEFTQGSTTYTTEVIGGRTMTRPTRNPDVYLVSLNLMGMSTGAAVSQQLYESLQAGDVVRVTYRHTRLSKRLLVTDVAR
jgi:hypothetical protein